MLVGLWLAGQERLIAAESDTLRVLPAGQLPNDRRLGPLKDLDGYFPFAPPETPEAWAERAEIVRRRVLVAAGLWPMPTKTPARAVLHGRIECDGYTVEKVYLESYPGHFVTGNLYRPRNKPGRLPAVLCPHGHWPSGRFVDQGAKAIREQIVQGAERFEFSGRFPIQARCVQLARMGCVVFHYDMVGYADSRQIPFELSHRFDKQRPEMDGRENWGFFSTQAELRLQNIQGLQTYNSIRALDWLSELPEVDPGRIAVTGASGGGTQTFLLCAVDPRPVAAFPAVMVSTAMQGGCVCENACLLRVDTGNIEIAGLFAPRPLGMTAANDWTHEIATKGLPELKQLYTMLGAGEHVMARPLVHFGHNYNYVSRAVMYGWLNKHLKLGFEEPVVEEDFKPLSIAEMTVWDEKHPAPEGGLDYERSLIRWMTEDSDRQIAALRPADSQSLAKYREVVGGAWLALLGRGLPEAAEMDREKIDKQDRGDYFLFKDLLRLKPHGEELPVVFLHPKDWKGQVVVWISGRGKRGLWGGDDSPRTEIRRLLNAGMAVAGLDLVYQGEFLAEGNPPEQSRQVENPRDAAAYTLGYNHALFAQRVHDILTLIAFVRHDEHAPKKIHLVGVEGGGPWVAAARAVAGVVVDRAAIDSRKFRFQNMRSWRDVDFLPGAVKYGDLPAVLALSAPHKLWLAGEGDQAPDAVRAAYDAGGAAGNVTLYDGATDGAADAASVWLLAE